MLENIQEIINELHRMKKEYNAPQGCCVRTQERNGYRSKCLSIAIKALSEVQTLAKAKAEGRLVELPCKVGDTVYRIISYKCNAVCNKLNACNSFIYKACKQAEFYVCPGTFQLNDMGWIGKTVFLTREEAEKALGGESIDKS